jgi:ribonuclease VapC
MEITPFSQSQAALAASWRGKTKTLGLALGDRACLALGYELKLPIFTADRIWKEVGIKGVDVRLIR